MELSDELLEQIGAYLSGQLPAGEKDRFEARLQQDAALRQEVAIQRELKQGLMFLAQKDRFRQMHTDLAARGLLADTDHLPVSPVSSEPQASEPPTRSFREIQPEPVRPTSRYGLASWVMAASVVLLLGIGWVVYQNQTGKRQELAQNERIFNTFFSTDVKPAPDIAIDPDRLAAPPEINQAKQDSVRLHAAVAAMRRADYQRAIQDLKAISSARPGHWEASAQWYLALAYLKNNQRAEAQSLLQTIAGLNGHPYQPDARQLLSQLPAAQPE